MAEARAGRGPAGDIGALVARTPFIDTHEHIVEEERRTAWKPHPLVPCNDWALLFSHYIDSDLQVAGMAPSDLARLLSPELDTPAKWKILAPWWPLVMHTGYGQAVRITIEQLYGVRDLDERSVQRLATAFEAAIRPGYYVEVLRRRAGIESCQVNSLEATFMETRYPDLLMQDISLMSLHGPYNWRGVAEQVGVRVSDLAGYHRAIDAWFARYGRYAVAVKSQAAYGRRLDFDDVPAERAEEPFARILRGDPLAPAEVKLVEDHLFWYGVRRATEHRLPIKLHTGYYAGHNAMPMDRIALNPADAVELMRRAPDTTFVLMHMGYPFHEQMAAIAKHWTNAVIDMCWAWIISPTASERFLRDMIVTAPRSKVLTFGGDYIPVEPVVGHAAIARRGIASTLNGLVRDGWLKRSDAADLVAPLLRGNAERVFRLEEKRREAARVPWPHERTPA
ncbi:MAG TPA: amidohydrolase family protein [Chthonomonadales bacterium]|nr:amidohydrolase family protein [Chthonomonadales bacterium]